MGCSSEIERASTTGRKLRDSVHAAHQHEQSIQPTWQRIPVDIHKRYFRSLLGADQLIFHTPRDVYHFKLHIRSSLADEVEIAGDTIRYGNRLLHLRAIPIGTSPNHLSALLASREMRAARQQIQELLGSDDIVIANVSRTDPIKNYIPLIEAMPLVLEMIPEALWERVTLACHLTLNRQNLPLYRDYRERGDETIRRINWQLGREVVKAYYSDNYHLALALMEKARVLAISSIAEGMNLTGLECCWISKGEPVLLLSENVGLSYYSEEWSIVVADPTSVEALSTGLVRALTLDPQQRATSAQMSRQFVETHTIEHWLQNRLQFAEEHLRTHQNRNVAGASKQPATPSSNMVRNYYPDSEGIRKLNTHKLKPLLEKLAEGYPLVLVSDVDKTLARATATPEETVLERRVPPALQEIASKGIVALTTGRPFEGEGGILALIRRSNGLAPSPLDPSKLHLSGEGGVSLGNQESKVPGSKKRLYHSSRR